MSPEASARTRRAALAGLLAVAAGAAAACTKRTVPDPAKPTAAAPSTAGSNAAGTPSLSSPPAQTPPDPAIVAAARARELALLAAYDAAVRDMPGMALLLADFRAHHVAHLERIKTLPGAPGAAESPALDTSGSAASTSTGTKAATEKARAVLAGLAQLERKSAADGAAACAAAGPTDFAVLLAEIAGNEAQHGALLTTFPVPS